MDNTALKNLIKSSLEGERLIKEVTFTEEIDRERSDRFFLDGGTLYFLYHISDTVGTDELLRIFGKVTGEGHLIRMSPGVEESVGDTVKRSHALVTTPIQRVSDIIEIDFNHNSQGSFYYQFINEYSFKIRKKFATGELQYTSQSFSDRQNKVIETSFNEKHLSINRYNGYDSIDNNNFDGLISDSPLMYVVNFKSSFSYVIQERIKRVLFDFSNESDENRYIFLGCIQKPETLEEMAFLINRINYGTQDGYIYMKPLPPAGKPIKIKMLFFGNPQIQYYQAKEQIWKTISDGELINCESEMQYRFKMAWGDAIYKLYFLEA